MPQPSREPKLRRKDLRQPDEFETLIGSATVWAQDHMRLVVGVAAVLLVGVLAVVVIRQARSGRDEAAAAGLRAAQVSFQAGKFSEAAEAFGAVSRDYPSSPSGQLAGLYKGHALAHQPDPAAAATAYSEYLTSAAGPPYLRQEALDGLGRAREATGDTTGALEAYEQAASLEGPYQVDALLGSARRNEAANHPDRAREIYERLLKETTDPDLRAFLLTRLPPGTTPTEPPPADTPARSRAPGFRPDLTRDAPLQRRPIRKVMSTFPARPWPALNRAPEPHRPLTHRSEPGLRPARARTRASARRFVGARPDACTARVLP